LNVDREYHHTLHRFPISSFSVIARIHGEYKQWRRQSFAPGGVGGTGAWRTGSEVRGDKVIQK